MPNKRPKAIILSQGDEVITGAIVDTNAAILADHCRTLGFDIIRHITVADELKDLVSVLHEIDQLADVCLCTGGLGPTDDDLTAEAFSVAFSAALEIDEGALRMMSEFFAKLNYPMAEVNHKQVLLPKNSTRIDNHWGTAPGFVAAGQGCQFYFMPGVPYEMNMMMESFVLDDLQRQFSLSVPVLVTFRMMELGESTIQQMLNELDIAKDIRVGFRAGLAENELKLLFPSYYSKADMLQYGEKMQRKFGDNLFAIDGLGKDVNNMADHIHQLMSSTNNTLTVVESLSQGGIAQQCHQNWLQKAQIFSPVFEIMSHFDLPHQTVSESLVLDVALKNKQQSKASISLVQLYEQSDDQHAQVYIAVVGHQKSLSFNKQVRGRLERQQVVAASLAFNTLRKFLLDL